MVAGIESVFLLDTNILSEPLKAYPNKKVLSMLERHEEVLSTASVVVHELAFGMQRLPRSKKRSQIEKYIFDSILECMVIHDFDEQAALWYAKERARLSKKGLVQPFADGQIAAIAAVNNLKLITRNLKDFKNFTGLKTASWFN